MTDTATQLEDLAARAVSLYSRPTVALEVVRLAEQPRIDAQSLKECISQDPALTGKLLRVVNSSLFGLHRPVADLNQAIALLGIKPLKLLVLGFSLPDSLFAEVAADELEWYWTNTLTRAVAARLLSEQLWRQAGDEAFIAGLLVDIGILVLLGELGEPYARFLTGVIKEGCDLAALERDTLGFDHVELTAAVLARWHLPSQVVDAIAAPKRIARLSRLSPPEGDLPQILHLAELLTQLVGQRRLTVLPELLEAGKLYRGMTKSKLITLVEGLQSQVDQLAEVLALELSSDRNYTQMLADAQAQMAVLSEHVAPRVALLDDDALCAQLLTHTGHLTDAMRAFLACKKTGSRSAEQGTQSHAAHCREHGRSRAFAPAQLRDATSNESERRAALVRKLLNAATRCRERRCELSLVVVEPTGIELHGDARECRAVRAAKQALANACGILNPEHVAIVALTDRCNAAVLSDCDRSTALAVGHQAIAAVNDADVVTANEDAPMLGIGVATVSVVPKNFDADKMVESALRCLSAARACGISAVKSIEV